MMALGSASIFLFALCAQLLHNVHGAGECSASAPCPNGLCCSQYGYCGTTTAYCGAGCVSQCKPSGTPAPTSKCDKCNVAVSAGGCKCDTNCDCLPATTPTPKPTTKKPASPTAPTLKPVAPTAKPVAPTGGGLSGNAAFTTYTSWAPCCNNPNVDQTECVQYNACQWAGWFAALPNQMSEDWVKSHDLISFYDNRDPKGTTFMKNYGGRYVQVTKGSVSFTALIADTCGNSDCGGCCTKNSLSTASGAPGTGYLVDMEYWTVLRHFGNINAADGAISFKIL